MEAPTATAPPPETALAARPPALAWLQVAFVAALAGPTLLLAYVGSVTHEETIDAARGRLARLAQIAQEQAQRVMETNEVISRGIATRIGQRSNDELRADREQLHAVMKAWTRDLPQLQSVWVWDEAGRPVATNLRPDPPPALNVSDREYFVWARGEGANGWYVSAPLRSRTTGELFFDFVRRRSGADGRFEGAVSVSLRPSYFDAFFREQVVREPGFALSLLRADGTLISRYPPPPVDAPPRLAADSPLRAAMTAGSPAGEVQGRSSIDGQYRYVAYRRIGELPLYAAATGSRGELLAPWRRSMAVLSAFTLPLAAGLAALCWFAMRRVRREHAIALALGEQYAQRLKAEEALRLAQKMEALGRLTGGVAHDFNNVLMVVQSCVTLARRLEDRGQPVAKALEPVERAVANGAQLTRQLLAVVRRQPLQPRTVDLAEVVPALARLMASTLGPGVTVVHAIDPALRLRVDQAELELALINLCINARDAMPDGGEIRIAADAAPPPDDATPAAPWLRLSVADSGQGMAPEVLARVTEPFFTTKPVGKGTGLGLSQVQAFVAQAGGRLAIDSAPGRGTRVSMLLPCQAAETPAAAAPPPAGALRRLDASVLLVDDNADIVQAVAAILRDAGARVRIEADADAGLRLLAAGERFDAVLSDISLPGEASGIDLAREAAARGIPALLMTGYTERLQEAAAAGLRVLPKPAPPQVLLDALADAVAAGASGVSTTLRQSSVFSSNIR